MFHFRQETSLKIRRENILLEVPEKGAERSVEGLLQSRPGFYCMMSQKVKASPLILIPPLEMEGFP